MLQLLHHLLSDDETDTKEDLLVRIKVLAAWLIVLFNQIFEKIVLTYVGKRALGVSNLFTPREPFKKLCASMGGQPRNSPALGCRNMNCFLLLIQVALNFCAAYKIIGTHYLMDCCVFLQSETALKLAFTLQGDLIPLLNNLKLDRAIASSSKWAIM